MPKSRNLRLEREITQLRNQNLGVREIARQLHVGPATVSRYLRKEVNRSILEALTKRLEETERTLRLVHQALQAVGNVLMFPGNPSANQKHLLSEALKNWPGEYRQHN